MEPHIAHHPDDQAVTAVRNGDAERYRELVERHERRVYAVAWSRLGDPHLAEEATQEAFIRGFRHLRLLGNGAKFAGWISAIARNTAINLGLRHRRELNKRQRWALEHPSPDAPENPDLCPPETLRQALAELPAGHRECLVLFYLEGRSGAEAAATLGISEGGFRVRLHRAKTALREHLESRLEGSLEKLRPNKTLVPAIMAAVLMSTSAKAATAGAAGTGLGAKIISILGKPFLLSWLGLFISLIGLLPGMILAGVVARAEKRNFRDAEGFRVRLYGTFFRSFLWGFPVFFVLVLVLNHSVSAAWGSRGAYLWTSLWLLGVTLLGARALAINRHPFQIGMVAYGVILTAGVWAVALGWIPPQMGQLPMLGGTVLLIFLLKHRPARMDYSLFLRAAHKLLDRSGEPASTSTPMTAAHDRAALQAFGRFIGERWLATNHRWSAHGLILRLAPMSSRFLANLARGFLPVQRGDSQIMLGWNGSVTAHCGHQDRLALAEMSGDVIADAGELERIVAGAVEAAWHRFCQGKLPDAAQALGCSGDADVFVVPPASARSTRWLQWGLGASVVAMAGAMIMGWHSNRLQMVSGRHLKPVTFSEADVRACLAQLATATNADILADQLIQAAQITEVLPPKHLFTADAWRLFERRIQTNLLADDSDSPVSRLDRFLGFPARQGAFLNDWISAERLDLNRQSVQEAIGGMSPDWRQRLFEIQVNAVGTHDGKPAGYTCLDAFHLSRRIRCLKKLGCLDLIPGSNTVSTLLRHQVLSATLPPGRRAVSDPQLFHGTFLTFGCDPVEDTWHALVILEAFGALNRIDREACIQGILRFHHGRGLFGSVRRDDQFVIFGDTRDTLYAFESLRMLGALDQAKDLPKWQFRPLWSSLPEAHNSARLLNERELEAWVCQQRFERMLRERRERPQAPVRSLLEP